MSRRRQFDVKAFLSATTAILGALSSLLATPNLMPFTLIVATAGAIYLLYIVMDRRHAACDAELQSYRWAMFRVVFKVNNAKRGEKIHLDVRDLFSRPSEEEEERFRSMLR